MNIPYANSHIIKNVSTRIFFLRSNNINYVFLYVFMFFIMRILLMNINTQKEIFHNYIFFLFIRPQNISGHEMRHLCRITLLLCGGLNHRKVKSLSLTTEKMLHCRIWPKLLRGGGGSMSVRPSLNPLDLSYHVFMGAASSNIYLSYEMFYRGDRGWKLHGRIVTVLSVPSRNKRGQSITNINL